MQYFFFQETPNTGTTEEAPAPAPTEGGDEAPAPDAEKPPTPEAAGGEQQVEAEATEKTQETEEMQETEKTQETEGEKQPEPSGMLAVKAKKKKIYVCFRFPDPT